MPCQDVTPSTCRRANVNPPPPTTFTHPTAPSQCLSGRVGLVTGKDIAQHCGEQWPRPARWLLWLLLEFAIVAVDIQETVGCAQGLAMLSQDQVPLWAGARRPAGGGRLRSGGGPRGACPGPRRRLWGAAADFFGQSLLVAAGGGREQQAGGCGHVGARACEDRHKQPV